MNKKLFSLLLATLLFYTTVFASRNTVIISTLSNNVVCDPSTEFTIYGPNNGTARWQTAFDTTQTPGQIFEYTAGIIVTQSDSVLYYRRLSSDYSDTSNWYKVRYMPKPTVTNLANYSICSGTSTQLTLTASKPSTFTYLPVTTIFGTTGASAGTGSQINQTLINPNNNLDGGIVYRITPTSIDGSCVGIAKDITISVLARPQITNIAAQNVCSGAVLTIPLTASIPSNYSWTNQSMSSGITGAKDSSGTTMLIKLLNASNVTNGTAVYAVEANSINGSCKSNAVNLTITVKALPTISSFMGDTICSGLVNEQVYFQNSIYSNIVWTQTQSQGVVGAQSGTGFVMRQSLNNNSTTTYGFVNYLINLTTVSGSCSTNNLPLKLYVAPTPKIIGKTEKLICNGSNTNLIPTTDYPGVFIWTLGAKTGNISGATTMLQSKTGIFQTLTNSGTTTGSQVYLVKHVLADAQCGSEPKSITISVSPTSNSLSLNDTLLNACNGTPFSDSIRSSPQASFYWNPVQNNKINGAIADSGVILNQTLFLMNNNTATQEFMLWPYIGNEGCSANPISIKVKVFALPQASFTYALSNDSFYFLPTDTSLTNYSWNFGDSSFSNKKTPIHQYTKAGKYLVKLQTYNANGCLKDSALEVVYAPVGINELTLNKQTKLYPNPASDFVALNTENIGNDFIIINVYNIVGALIKSEHLNKTNQQINVAELSNGVYVIEIKHKEWRESQKLIIQR
ncbi:MAG: T9SS type A sorting domain-containing protein [Bacteroidia bacterium]|nr:T9SS type A sorting domain-containing protein [Bacteroidia bacterium]